MITTRPCTRQLARRFRPFLNTRCLWPAAALLLTCGPLSGADGTQEMKNYWRVEGTTISFDT
jgi:hypothetical protein